MLIEAWFDGCVEPRNPGGHGAYGVLVKVDGAVVLAEGVYCGSGPEMSNNVAEYSGCIRALEEIKKYPGVKAIIRGDSKLVINQLLDKWESHGGFYVPYMDKAKKLLAEIQNPKRRVKLEWVRRTENNECDVLSKKVLLDRGIKFRIQPEAA